jgi:hypothetical protein
MTRLLEVPGRRGEEFRGGLLFGRGPGSSIDNALDALQRLGQACSGDHVHTLCARHRHDVVAPRDEQVDDMTADPPSRSGYGDSSV